jgi:hypothetical protein
MLFQLFLALLSAIEEPEGLVTMNRVFFRRYVEAREPYQPWLVAFTRNGSKKCRYCIPLLEQVAARSYGYLFVGKVDQDLEPLLAQDYGVERNWTIFLFNKDGHVKLTGLCDAQKYYRLLLDNLPNEVLDADPTWLQSSKTKPSAILFTSRFRIPPMWRAIAGYFKDKGLRVGLCTEQEYFDKFHVRTSPTVLYLNKSGEYPVENAQDYKTLRSYLNAVRRNKIPPVKPTVQRFFLASQFQDECKPGNICVFHASQSMDPRFALRETRFADPRLRFFSGLSDLPFKFVKEGEIWLFSGDRTGVTPVRDIQDLDDVIKFTLRGALRWTPIAEYAADEL